MVGYKGYYATDSMPLSNMYLPGNDHIFHLGKRNIVFKSSIGRGYVWSQEGIHMYGIYIYKLATVFLFVCWEGPGREQHNTL